MRFTGEVVAGAGMAGERLGCPTANIGLAPGESLAPGVYVALTSLPGDAARYPSAAYVGEALRTLEVHLLDWQGNLRGLRIIVELGERIGGVVAWESETQMRAKIADDIARVRQWFVDHPRVM